MYVELISIVLYWTVLYNTYIRAGLKSPKGKIIHLLIYVKLIGRIYKLNSFFTNSKKKMNTIFLPGIF